MDRWLQVARIQAMVERVGYDGNTRQIVVRFLARPGRRRGYDTGGDLRAGAGQSPATNREPAGSATGRNTPVHSPRCAPHGVSDSDGWADQKRDDSRS